MDLNIAHFEQQHKTRVVWKDALHSRFQTRCHLFLCFVVCRKYEEIYPPEVGEFVYITDDTYTKKQVLRMEHLVLKVLSFDVAIPTINVFCERFLKQCNASEKTLSLVMVSDFK